MLDLVWVDQQMKLMFNFVKIAHLVEGRASNKKGAIAVIPFQYDNADVPGLHHILVQTLKQGG